jgi:predicted transposase YdaD
MTVVEQYIRYKQEESRAEALEEGMEIGREEERAKFFQRSLEIAKYLIKAGNPLNEVAKITKLDIKQLKKLRASV